MNLLPKDDEMPEKTVKTAVKKKHVMDKNPATSSSKSVLLEKKEKLNRAVGMKPAPSPKVVKSPVDPKRPSSSVFMLLLSFAVVLLVLINVLIGGILGSVISLERRYYSNNKTVFVNSNPDESDVFINNVYIGITPISIIDLNANQGNIIKIRKPGFADYNIVFDGAKTSYMIDLEKSTNNLTADNGAVTKIIKWADFGLTLNVPKTYTESSDEAYYDCKDVKQYLVVTSRCANTNTQIEHYFKKLIIPSTNSSAIMSVRLPSPTDLCTTTSTKCSGADVKKLETITFLGQSVDVYKSEKSGVTTIFLQPAIKLSGTEYNAAYIEFIGSTDYKTVLSYIQKNA